MKKWMLLISIITAAVLLTCLGRSTYAADDAVVYEQETEDSKDVAESISEVLTGYAESGEDPSKLQRVKIMELRSAYEHLSMAEKTRVQNLYILKKAEELLEIQYIEEETLSEDPETLAGMVYTFEVRDDRPKLSLSIRYMTDEDKDGTIDRPNLSLKSPSGEEILLRENTNTMSGDKLTLDLTWQESFVQLDIRSAENGLWQVASTNVVYFSLSEYLGAEEAAFAPAEEDDTAEVSERTGSGRMRRSAAVIRALRPLIIFTAVVVAGIVGFVVFWKMKKNGFKRKALRTPEDDDDDYEYDDEEREARRIKEEEELQSMQRLIDNQQIFMDDGYDDYDDAEEPRKESEEEQTSQEENSDPGYVSYEVYPSQMDDEEDDDPKDVIEDVQKEEVKEIQKNDLKTDTAETPKEKPAKMERKPKKKPEEQIQEKAPGKAPENTTEIIRKKKVVSGSEFGTRTRHRAS